VPAAADDAILEACRLEVQTGLEKVTGRAYDIVDRKDRHAGRS